MSYTYLLAEGEESSAESFSGIPVFVLSRLNLIEEKRYCNGNVMECCPGFQSGTTYTPLTVGPGRDSLTSYAADSHARIFHRQEKGPASPEKEVAYGRKWQGSFAKYIQNSHSWKTHHASHAADSMLSLGIWPRWGMMRNGECWELAMLEQITKEKEPGSSQRWPTPCTMDSLPVRNPIALRRQYVKNRKGRKAHSTLREAVIYPPPLEMWPTITKSTRTFADIIQAKYSGNGGKRPSYSQAKLIWQTPRKKGMCGGSGAWAQLKKNMGIKGARKIGAGNGGSLNPDWAEWLMGWPIGWTELKPLEMARFRQWLRYHGR